MSRSDKYYVIMDPRDYSVTLSPELFEHLGGFDSCHRVYVFKLSGSYADYAFTVNPDFGEETQIADVQVNTATKEVGFECLIPSVVMMFARWSFDLERPRIVPVHRIDTGYDGGDVYQFDFDDSVYAK